MDSPMDTYGPMDRMVWGMTVGPKYPEFDPQGILDE